MTQNSNKFKQNTLQKEKVVQTLQLCSLLSLDKPLTYFPRKPRLPLGYLAESHSGLWMTTWQWIVLRFNVELQILWCMKSKILGHVKTKNFHKSSRKQKHLDGNYTYLSKIVMSYLVWGLLLIASCLLIISVFQNLTGFSQQSNILIQRLVVYLSICLHAWISSRG